MTPKKVHCFFEQSGTFRDEFVKLGIPSEDYDIGNEFGKTDHQIDLFEEIGKGYEGEASVFDQVGGEDMIMAFFPCIYFEALQQTVYALCSINMRKQTMTEKINTAIERIHKRTYFHELLYKLTYICCDRHIPLVIENPASAPNYLISGQNFPTPTLIDKDRTMRGDWFVKPTAYWFFNCEPTHGETLQRPMFTKQVGKCKSSPRAGECSLERSLISPDYARNFICDYILGRKIVNSQLDLFEQ